MAKPKVYLSGSMTNNPDYEKDFLEAQEAFENNGVEVVNPMYLDHKDSNYQNIMRKDLFELLKCDFIYFVNDITKSKGAFLERVIASECGIMSVKIDKEEKEGEDSE